MRVLFFSAAALFLLGLTGCGGATEAPPTAPEKPAAVVRSENGIEIVRESFSAMGGLERIRLLGGNLMMKTTVLTEGDSFPVEITIAGRERWRIDYVRDGIRYVYDKDNCLKIVYDVPARCTPDERIWIAPTYALVGLLYPDGDAAGLKSRFRLLGEETVNGQPCDVVEVRPENSNLRIQALYSRLTKLPLSIRFSLGNGPKNSSIRWTVNVEDWREVAGVKLPFARTVVLGDKVVWRGRADSIEPNPESDRAFEPPSSPDTGLPVIAAIPERRVFRQTIEGQEFEIPAPYPTVGGGPNVEGQAILLPRIEKALRMIVKSPIADLPAQKEAIKKDPNCAALKAGAEPQVILLEQAGDKADPVLMILYMPL